MPESRAGARGSRRGTRRHQSPGQGPGAPAGEPEDHVLWGVTTHRSQPAALRMESSMAQHVRVSVCVWTHACVWAEKEREKKEKRGGRGEEKALLPIEIFF